MEESVFVTLYLEIRTDPKTADKLRYILSKDGNREMVVKSITDRVAQLRGVTGGVYQILGRLWVK